MIFKMHKLKYEIVHVGHIHDSKVYASATECPFLDIMKTMMVGSQACFQCEFHDSMDDELHVFCKNPKELKCQ